MAELGLEPRELAPGTLHSSPFVSYCLKSNVPLLSNDRARTDFQSCAPFTVLCPEYLSEPI